MNNKGFAASAILYSILLLFLILLVSLLSGMDNKKSVLDNLKKEVRASVDAGADTTPPSIQTLQSSTKTSSTIAAVYDAAVDSESEIASYSCYYGTSSSNVTSVGTVNNTTCNISGLTQLTTYYFKMCAKNSYNLESCSVVSNLSTIAAARTVTLTLSGTCGVYENTGNGLPKGTCTASTDLTNADYVYVSYSRYNNGGGSRVWGTLCGTTLDTSYGGTNGTLTYPVTACNGTTTLYLNLEASYWSGITINSVTTHYYQ